MQISFELNLNTSNLKQLIRGIAPPDPYHQETFYDENLNFSNKGLNMCITLFLHNLKTTILLYTFVRVHIKQLKLMVALNSIDT